MVAALTQGGSAGREIYQGEKKAYLIDNSTTVLKARAGRLTGIYVSNAGTGWQFIIYDDPATSNLPNWIYVTTDAKVALKLDIPMPNGITVISSGTTPGVAVITFT